MSRENVDTVVRVIGAINRRDVEAALRELGDDAEYIDHRASGREHFRGHQAFRAHFAALWKSADVQIVAEKIADPGDRVVMRQAVASVDPSGLRSESVRWVTRTVLDGRIQRVEVFDNRDAALEAVGLQE